MKRTILMTIMAMGLALGASRADAHGVTNKAEENHSLADAIQVGGKGVITNDLPPRYTRRPRGIARFELLCQMDRQLGGTSYDA